MIKITIITMMLQVQEIVIIMINIYIFIQHFLFVSLYAFYTNVYTYKVIIDYNDNTNTYYRKIIVMITIHIILKMTLSICNSKVKNNNDNNMKNARKMKPCPFLTNFVLL